MISTLVICGLLSACAWTSVSPAQPTQTLQPNHTPTPEETPSPSSASPSPRPVLSKSDFVPFEMDPDAWLAILDEHCAAGRTRELWEQYGMALGEFSEETVDAPNASCEFQELGWRKWDGKNLYECAVIYQGNDEFGYMDRIFVFSRIGRDGKWKLTDYFDVYSPRRLSGNVATYVTAEIDYDGNCAAFLVLTDDLGGGIGIREVACVWYSLDVKAEVLRHFGYGYQASEAGVDGWNLEAFWMFRFKNRMSRLMLFYDYSTYKNDWNRETDKDYSIPLISGQRTVEFEWNPDKGEFTLIGEPRLTSAWSLPGSVSGYDRRFHWLEHNYRDWSREFVPELKELTKSTYAYAREWARERLDWLKANPDTK